MSPKALSPGRRRAEAEGGSQNFRGAGPAIFEGTRPTPKACDYDAAHGVPAGHPTARNAASNMRDERGKRTKPGPGDREQNSGSVGITLGGFRRDAK